MAQMTVISSLCRSGNGGTASRKLIRVTTNVSGIGKFTNSEDQSFSLPLWGAVCRPEAFLLGLPMAVWVALQGIRQMVYSRSNPS